VATGEGSLVIECPACPHPGKNLPENWEDAPPALQYVFNALFISRTLMKAPLGFSTRSSLPLMQTSNSRVRIEGSKTFNLTLVGAAMSRAQDTRDMSQIMLTNLRHVDFFYVHSLSYLHE